MLRGENLVFPKIRNLIKLSALLISLHHCAGVRLLQPEKKEKMLPDRKSETVPAPDEIIYVEIQWSLEKSTWSE